MGPTGVLQHKKGIKKNYYTRRILLVDPVSAEAKCATMLRTAPLKGELIFGLFSNLDFVNKTNGSKMLQYPMWEGSTSAWLHRGLLCSSPEIVLLHLFVGPFHLFSYLKPRFPS